MTEKVIKNLKKIDLHRHIEGSVSPGAIFKLCQKDNRNKKMLSYFEKEMVLKKRAKSLDEFIKKLGTRFLKEYISTPEDLVFVFRDAAEAAAADNVSYLELRFALSNFLHLGDPVSLVKAISQATKIKLVLTLKRDDDKSINFEVLKAAKKLYKSGDIVGVDLAGNEHFYPNQLFIPLAREIKKAGLPFTVHAGEVTDARSVETAVNLLGADRIGHGTKAAQDEKVMNLLVRKNVLLEVCPTSNLDTSAYKSYQEIPIRTLLDAKVPILICTDDPVTSGITLSWEVKNLIDRKIISLGEYQKMLKNAKKYTFN